MKKRKSASKKQTNKQRRKAKEIKKAEKYLPQRQACRMCVGFGG